MGSRMRGAGAEFNPLDRAAGVRKPFPTDLIEDAPQAADTPQAAEDLRGLSCLVLPKAEGPDGFDGIRASARDLLNDKYRHNDIVRAALEGGYNDYKGYASCRTVVLLKSRPAARGGAQAAGGSSSGGGGSGGGGGGGDDVLAVACVVYLGKTANCLLITLCCTRARRRSIKEKMHFEALLQMLRLMAHEDCGAKQQAVAACVVRNSDLLPDSSEWVSAGWLRYERVCGQLGIPAAAMLKAQETYPTAFDVDIHLARVLTMRSDLAGRMLQLYREHNVGALAAAPKKESRPKHVSSTSVGGAGPSNQRARSQQSSEHEVAHHPHHHHQQQQQQPHPQQHQHGQHRRSHNRAPPVVVKLEQDDEDDGWAGGMGADEQGGNGGRRGSGGGGSDGRGGGGQRGGSGAGVPNVPTPDPSGGRHVGGRPVDEQARGGLASQAVASPSDEAGCRPAGGAEASDAAKMTVADFVRARPQELIGARILLQWPPQSPRGVPHSPRGTPLSTNDGVPGQTASEHVLGGFTICLVTGVDPTGQQHTVRACAGRSSSSGSMDEDGSSGAERLVHLSTCRWTTVEALEEMCTAFPSLPSSALSKALAGARRGRRAESSPEGGEAGAGAAAADIEMAEAERPPNMRDHDGATDIAVRDGGTVLLSGVDDTRRGMVPLSGGTASKRPRRDDGHDVGRGVPASGGVNDGRVRTAAPSISSPAAVRGTASAATAAALPATAAAATAAHVRPASPRRGTAEDVQVPGVPSWQWEERATRTSAPVQIKVEEAVSAGGAAADVLMDVGQQQPQQQQQQQQHSVQQHPENQLQLGRQQSHHKQQQQEQHDAQHHDHQHHHQQQEQQQHYHHHYHHQSVPSTVIHHPQPAPARPCPPSGSVVDAPYPRQELQPPVGLLQQHMQPPVSPQQHQLPPPVGHSQRPQPGLQQQHAQPLTQQQQQPPLQQQHSHQQQHQQQLPSQHPSPPQQQQQQQYNQQQNQPPPQPSQQQQQYQHTYQQQHQPSQQPPQLPPLPPQQQHKQQAVHAAAHVTRCPADELAVSGVLSLPAPSLFGPQQSVGVVHQQGSGGGSGDLISAHNSALALSGHQQQPLQQCQQQHHPPGRDGDERQREVLTAALSAGSQPPPSLDAIRHAFSYLVQHVPGLIGTPLSALSTTPAPTPLQGSMTRADVIVKQADVPVVQTRVVSVRRFDVALDRADFNSDGRADLFVEQQQHHRHEADRCRDEGRWRDTTGGEARRRRGDDGVGDLDVYCRRDSVVGNVRDSGDLVPPHRSPSYLSSPARADGYHDRDELALQQHHHRTGYHRGSSRRGLEMRSRSPSFDVCQQQQLQQQQQQPRHPPSSDGYRASSGGALIRHGDASAWRRSSDGAGGGEQQQQPHYRYRCEREARPEGGVVTFAGDKRHRRSAAEHDGHRSAYRRLHTHSNARGAAGADDLQYWDSGSSDAGGGKFCDHSSSSASDSSASEGECQNGSDAHTARWRSAQQQQQPQHPPALLQLPPAPPRTQQQPETGRNIVWQRAVAPPASRNVDRGRPPEPPQHQRSYAPQLHESRNAGGAARRHHNWEGAGAANASGQYLLQAPNSSSELQQQQHWQSHSRGHSRR